MISKFVGFFRLVEACGQPGCPVCHCLREEGVRYLDALMYEQVNDPATRGTLRASWGFCNWHAWQLEEIPHGRLGTAIVYADLLGRALAACRRLLARLDRGALGRGGLLGFLRRRPRVPFADTYRDRSECLVCRSLRVSEAAYLQIILDFTGDPEFDLAFTRSAGLCVPHLARLVDLGRDHHRLELIVQRSEKKWQALQDQVKRFIDKHDYRATEKFTEEEAQAWRQAMEMLAGAPGLFGNELHPPGRHALAAPPDTAPRPEPRAGEQEVEALRFEKAKLELRLKDLTEKFNEVSSRAAALHYRLWQVLEDRKVLEMNLSGAEASSRLWERKLEELQKEVARLKDQAGDGASGRAE